MPGTWNIAKEKIVGQMCNSNGLRGGKTGRGCDCEVEILYAYKINLFFLLINALNALLMRAKCEIIHALISTDND